MILRVVHCLKCDNLYGEKNKFIEVCPFCGNEDTQKTVYLSEEGDMYKEFMGELNENICSN
jgi:hypothetical protein|tara:strand:+ start:2393 stop:2575 length:183 start_codon:yes stop_codon:yes gene_type:complete